MGNCSGVVRAKPVCAAFTRCGARYDRSSRRQAAWGSCMVKSALVSFEIDAGDEVLAAIDRAGLSVAVALWAYLDEYEDWRLVLASRALDPDSPREAYRLLNQSLRTGGFDGHMPT